VFDHKIRIHRKPCGSWPAGDEACSYTGRKPGDSANSFDVPAFVVYDTTVSHDLGKLGSGLRGLRTSLNVQNLFDREYVSDCNYSFGCYYGQERVAAVEMTYDW
jgi:iron complex outermembrane receptor protein